MCDKLLEMLKNLRKNVFDYINPNIGYAKHIMSFPIYNDGKYHIFTSEEMTSFDIHIKNFVFKNAGISVDKCSLPCLPMTTLESYKYSNGDYIAIWINIIVGNKYDLSIINNMTIHIFLVYTYFVDHSCSDRVRHAYKNIGKNITKNIVDDIENGNYTEITLLKRIKNIKKKYKEFNMINVIHVCEFIVKVYFNNLCCKKLFATDNNNKKINYWKICEHSIEQISNKEYTCCYTLEDTSRTGGFMINSHPYNNHICSPKYVLSNEAFIHLRDYNIPKCPLCKSVLNIYSSFIFVSKHNPYTNNNYHLNGYKNDHKIVISLQVQNDCLIKLSEFDFKISSYEFTDTHIIKAPIKYTCMSIFSDREFKKKAYSQYSFIKLLSFKNYAICGGFNRSILLNQCVNDIDIFMHDDNDMCHNADVFNRTVKDVTNSIMKCRKNVSFMFLFKETSNVFEILALQNDKLYCKVQVILKMHKNIYDIISNFDMHPTRVAFDGKHVYFTRNSARSYKYMVNYLNIDTDKCIDQYDIDQYDLDVIEDIDGNIIDDINNVGNNVNGNININKNDINKNDIKKNDVKHVDKYEVCIKNSRAIKYLYYGFDIAIANDFDDSFLNIVEKSFLANCMWEYCYFRIGSKKVEIQNMGGMQYTVLSIRNIIGMNENVDENSMYCEYIEALCKNTLDRDHLNIDHLNTDHQESNNANILENTLNFIQKTNEKDISIFIKKASEHDIMNIVRFDDMNYDNCINNKKINVC